MTAGELRHHLTRSHDWPTTGWTWDALVAKHGRLHAAVDGAMAGTHRHDPDVDPVDPR